MLKNRNEMDSSKIVIKVGEMKKKGKAKKRSKAKRVTEIDWADN